MHEILALLLPVAAASGWIAAVRHLKKRSTSHLDRLNYAYFQGMNYLLNERPDKALEIFVYLLEEGNETVDTHFALGSLFRRRGEVERAIGIHKRLLDRTDLFKDQRRHALFELGMDYMGAGLYDHAKAFFVRLVNDGAYEKAALEQLVHIHQHEKDWLKAIEYKRKLDKIAGIKRDESVAQFYCELALEANKAGNMTQALEFLKQGLTEDPSCVRVSLIEAEIHIAQLNYGRALDALKRVETQDPSYLCEALNPLIKCFEKLDESDEQIKYLSHLYDRYQVAEVTGEIAKLLEIREGDKRAIEFLFETLDAKPTIQGFNALISRLLTCSSGENRKILFKLREFCSKVLVVNASYQCERCGFSGKQLHWCCPGCHQWETIKPVAMKL